jgi:hypothetical protein
MGVWFNHNLFETLPQPEVCLKLKNMSKAKVNYITRLLSNCDVQLIKSVYDYYIVCLSLT